MSKGFFCNEQFKVAGATCFFKNDNFEAIFKSHL